jgi:hypothetical protein
MNPDDQKRRIDTGRHMEIERQRPAVDLRIDDVLLDTNVLRENHGWEHDRGDDHRAQMPERQP